jgi:NAD(P)-dependent dehydrogenase (short-subunit alcohol dehydrogenase family)
MASNAPAPTRPSRSLTGRVAIITGAGSQGDGIGNGRAAAILLAEVGCAVACVDMKLQDAERTAEMINSEGHGKAIALAADVTREEECSGVVALTVEKFGRLDILVNNVGIMGAKGTAKEVDMEAWEAGMRVNVSSMVMMAKYAIREMEKNELSPSQPCRGAIVNLGSVAGLRGGTPHLMYPTSKGAVVNLTVSQSYIKEEESEGGKSNFNREPWQHTIQRKAFG